MYASQSNLSPRAARLPRALDRSGTQGQWTSHEEAIMGTAVRVELWSADDSAAQSVIAEVMREMHRIDHAMSPFKPDSELSRINRDAALRPVAIGQEMFELIARSIEFSQLSDGAFDITYAGVGHLYDYRACIKPTEAAIQQACAAVGYEHLLLDRAKHTIAFAREGVRIDLGGFAKGHAVDRCVAILERRGITNAMVSAGGDSRVLGDRCGRPWTVAIRDPRRPGEVVAVLPLENTAMSTSGDYERYFERDGVRCHHVIDPKTGKSPAEVRSVTILSPDGLTAEALSKSVFVMGVKQGLRLVESEAGVDAVVVDASGALHYSSGLLAGSEPAIAGRCSTFGLSGRTT